ncbi:hypothetical protein LINPERHAP1_LOCUS20882 [Linum perenne]
MDLSLLLNQRFFLMVTMELKGPLKWQRRSGYYLAENNVVVFEGILLKPSMDKKKASPDTIANHTQSWKQP